MDPRVTAWSKRQCRRAEHGDGGRLFHCGDPLAEYRALREGAALILDPGWSGILAEGKDAADYLHRRLTQDIKGMKVGGGGHALLLGGDGRLQAEFLAWRGDGAVLLLAPDAERERAFELLEKYILTDEVELTRFWEGESVVALAGPLAAGILRSYLDPRPDPLLLATGGWPGWFTVNFAGLPCRVFCDGRWNIPYYYFSVPAMALDQLLNALADAAGCIAGDLALEMVRIESGIAAFGRDTDARTIPLEAGLEKGVAFDKGCYPGQEILARIRNLGHPAKILVRMTGKANASIAGATSTASLPGLDRTEGLGYIPWEELGHRPGTASLRPDFDPAKISKTAKP